MNRQQISKYSVQYPKSAYRFPDEALAERLDFDDDYMHIYLTDGRIVSVPLAWIPTLLHASAEDRQKYGIGWDGKLLFWDPDECSINEDLLVATYLKASTDEDATEAV